MACKPQYKGIRYNSLEELYEANGVNPQQKQEAQQLYSEYLESLNKPNTNPILQGNQQEQVKKFAELQERLNNKEFIEGAKNAYESSKGLQEWGTQEQYNDYIARVSLGIVKNPTSGEYNYESQVKDIVYHGTKSKNRLEIFDENQIGALDSGYFGRGFYLTPDKQYASNYIGTEGHIESLIVNVQKPLETDMNKANTNISLNNNDSAIVTFGEDLAGLNEVYQNPNEIAEIVIKESNQIHILGSKQDIEGFKQWNSRQQQVSELFESNPELANEAYEALGFGNLLSLEDILKEYTKNLFHTYLKNNPNGNITEFKLYIASIKKLIDEKGKILTKELIDLLNNNEDIKPGVSELFESNPTLANAVYEALGLNTINVSEITYTDEEGNPCAKMGLTNTVKGTDWKIVKDFKGKPKHSNGGVDITISDKGVTIRRGGKDIKAKYGLLIINNN